MFTDMYNISGILSESPPPSWENLEAVLKAIRTVVHGLVDFIKVILAN